MLVLSVQILSAEYSGPQNTEELRQAIEKILKETNIPGAAVAIVSPDKVEWLAGIGLADEATNRPVTPQTLFRIGSVSKGFVALAALKLQEEGKLKLTDTFKQWVPECPLENAWEATDPVRLDQLLEHTAGIPEFRISEYAHNDPAPTPLVEALAFWEKYRVVRWRPGSYYAYSSVGTALAAAVVEKASGQRFEDYVRENIFRPLQMDTASYFYTPEVKANLTTMYWSKSHKIAPYHHLIYRAPGAINASIHDMTNYARFYLQRGSFGGQQVLRPTSIERMEHPKTSPAAQVGVTVGYGLCTNSMYIRGYKWYGHLGQRDACFVAMQYCPELEKGVLVMVNSNTGGERRILDLLRRYVMRNAPAKTFPTPGPMPGFLTKDFNGIYANIAPRDEGYRDFREYYTSIRKFTINDTDMVMQRGSYRWVPMEGNLFRLSDGMEPELAVIKGEDGKILFQCFLGTFRRISAVGFWTVIWGMLISFGLLLTAVLFAPVWGLRLAFGRLKNAGPLGLRLWPLVGFVGVVGFIAFYTVGQEGHIGIIGTMNLWTVGLMLDTLLIPLGAIVNVWLLWRHRRVQMNRVAYWHAVLVTLGLWFITGFGLSWGLIGIRLWA